MPQGHEFIGPHGIPSWCINPIHTYLSTDDDSLSYQIDEATRHGKKMIIPFSFYLIISILYTFLDMSLSLAIWSAASVGTPTEPRGRDQVIRTLIWFKMIAMNIILLGVFGSGIYLISQGRKYNYGCGPDREDVQVAFEVGLFIYF